MFVVLGVVVVVADVYNKLNTPTRMIAHVDFVGIDILLQFFL